MNLGLVLFNVFFPVSKVVEQTGPFNLFWTFIEVTDLI